MRYIRLRFVVGLFVLCCCRVYGGGTCCAEVSYCSGGFVPGCICSSLHPETPSESYACKLNIVQAS